MKQGVLYGVGVGPGDPELISLKAHRLIQNADLIVYPTDKEGVGTAHQIVAEFISVDQKLHGFHVPMSKDRTGANLAYDGVSEIIKTALNAGQNVVYLCEGDAFFYGSFIYVFDRLEADCEIEIIPAVPAFIAASAALKKPSLILNQSLNIIPATLPKDEILKKMKDGNQIAFYKIGRHFEKIYQMLSDQNLLEHAHLCEYVSHKDEKITPLNEVNPTHKPYFSLIMLYKPE